MDFRSDERGQPVVIGALLVFAILVLAFAGYQAVVVPQQNAEVEYNHFQQVESQFSELRTAATNAVGSGEQRSATITLGTQYTPRLIALNPSAPSGNLETTNEGEIEIGDLEYTSADLCDTDADEITSRSLHYQPGYHEHRSPESITYENTFRARSFRDGGRTRFDGQSLVQPAEGDRNTRINLLVLTGSFSRSSGDAFDLDLNPTHRYSVDVTTDEEFSVTVPSQFSADKWENEILDGVEVVVGVEEADNRVRIVFEEGEYRVSCAVVGLNSQPAYKPPKQPSTVLDVQWDRAQMSEQDGVQYDEETDTIIIDREEIPSQNVIEGYAKVQNAGGANEPVEDAFVDFSTINTNVTDFHSSGTDTGEFGEVVVDITIGAEGESRIFAASGDDVDTLRVEAVSGAGEASGTVNVEDVITESQDSFQVDLTFQNTEDDDAYLVVENEDEGVETARTVLSDGQEIIEANDVGGLTDGDSVRATLFESSARENELDTDSTAVIADNEYSISIDRTERQGTNGGAYRRIGIEWSHNIPDGETGTVTARLLDDSGTVLKEDTVNVEDGEVTLQEDSGESGNTHEVEVILYDSDEVERDRDRLPVEG